MLDLLIRGGDVVTPHGVENCDIAVAGETIAALAAPGTLPAPSARRTIEATERIVMPGGIDPHVHLKHVWTMPDGSPLVTAGPEQVGAEEDTVSIRQEKLARRVGLASQFGGRFSTNADMPSAASCAIMFFTMTSLACA